MKVLYGSIVADARGSIGDCVASRNHAGAFWRQRVDPLNPSTSYQVTSRARITTTSQAWRNLTSAQRLAWNSRATEFPQINCFGQRSKKTGFILFCELNMNRLIMGASILNSPPNLRTVRQPQLTSLTAKIGNSTIYLGNNLPVPDDCHMFVFATEGLSAGITYVRSAYRLITTIPMGSGFPRNLYSQYVAKYTTMPVAGKKIFCKACIVNYFSGIRSGFSTINTIVIP